MKNVLIISTTEEELLSNVNDGTNRLFINGAEIPSSSWVGTGNYTATVEGHSVTIKKIDSTDGNISLARTADYTYEMRRRTPSSSTGVESIVQTTTSHDDGGTNIVTCTLTDGTETEFEIRNGNKGSTGETGPQGPQGPTGPQGPKGDGLISQVTDADCNTITQTGCYSFGGGSTSLSKHYPLQSSGTLLVYNASAYVIQIFCPNANAGADMYMRSSVNGGSSWLAWARYNNDITGANPTDANTLFVDSKYAIGVWCTNLPTSADVGNPVGTLVVHDCGVYVVQIYVAQEGKIFTRVSTDKSTWSAWKRYMSGFRKDLLWSGSKTSTLYAQLNLAKSIADYDYIMVETMTNIEYYVDMGAAILNGVITVSHFADDSGYSSGKPSYMSHLSLQFTSNTQITIIGRGGNNINWILGVTKVWGVNF